MADVEEEDLEQPSASEEEEEPASGEGEDNSQDEDEEEDGAPTGSRLLFHASDGLTESSPPRLKRARPEDDEDETDELAPGTEDQPIELGSDDSDSSRSSVEDAWQRPPKRFRLDEGGDAPSDNEDEDASEPEPDFGSDDDAPADEPTAVAKGPAFMGPAAAKPVQGVASLDSNLDDELASDSE